MLVIETVVMSNTPVLNALRREIFHRYPVLVHFSTGDEAQYLALGKPRYGLLIPLFIAAGGAPGSERWPGTWICVTTGPLT